MNRIKIIIDNIANSAIESFKRTRVYIEDFPVVVGIKFLIHVWSITKIKVRDKVRILFTSNLHSVSKTKFRSYIADKLKSRVGMLSTIGFRINYRLRLLSGINPVSKIVGRLRYRIVILSRVGAITKILSHLAIFYRIDERRENFIQEIQSLPIQDFIKRELV